jgi:YegS/Rv2252/BmrU family lipid kinase
MTGRFLAIVNPAAGGGRCGRMAKDALAKLRSANIEIEVAETKGPGEATSLARRAYAQGCRQFIAVGGDGTACEIVNGLFPESATSGRATLGFLPLGTGNSFLRDFSERGAEDSSAAIAENRRRPCDVLRLRHSGGDFYFINLLSMGFAADAAVVTNRRFKALGQLGYIFGVMVCLARLQRRAFPLRADSDAELDRQRCLFLSFNNSKFTGGKMMIAPQAETDDGLIEYVRWGPVGRLQLLANFPKLFDGTHVQHPQASRRAVRQIEFQLDAPVDVMVDGETLTLDCHGIDVLPGALDVLV